MTIRLKVINCKWARMMHMRIKCQHQRWTLLHQPNACMATTMNPTLVAFGTFEPPLQIQIVYWQISPLSSHKQPRLKTAHHLGKLLVNGVHACPPLLPQRDELCLTLLPCGFVTRLQDAIDCSQVLDIVPHLRQGLAGDLQAAVNTTGQPLQVVYLSAAENSIGPKTRYNAPSHPTLEGALPWSHTMCSTNSLCWRSSGSSSCCISRGPSQAGPPHPCQRSPSASGPPSPKRSRA